MNQPSPKDNTEREKLEQQMSEILTKLENAVEQSTVARIHGKMSNNRLVHANAMTELADFITAREQALLDSLEAAGPKKRPVFTNTISGSSIEIVKGREWNEAVNEIRSAITAERRRLG